MDSATLVSYKTWCWPSYILIRSNALAQEREQWSTNSQFLRGNLSQHSWKRTICCGGNIQLMTTVSSFVFKGKGLRVKTNPPNGLNVQWAEKGSYRLEPLLKFVLSLPPQPVLFSKAKFKIYTLDDYSVNLCPEVKAVLCKNKKKDTSSL